MFYSSFILFLKILECFSFGCLTSNLSRDIYAITRLAVAISNTIIGFTFMILLYFYRKKKQRNSISDSIHKKTVI